MSYNYSRKVAEFSIKIALFSQYLESVFNPYLRRGRDGKSALVLRYAERSASQRPTIIAVSKTPRATEPWLQL